MTAHKISFATIEPSPRSASNTCYARKPSLPDDVPLENDLMHQKIILNLSTRWALENKIVSMDGCGMYGFLAFKTFIKCPLSSVT